MLRNERYDFILKKMRRSGGTGASGVLSGGNVQPSFHSGFQADRSGWKSGASVQIDGKNKRTTLPNVRMA